MNGSHSRPTPGLRLVHAAEPLQEEWAWFCGHCASPSPDGAPPAPNARVCTECGFGLLLEARSDVIPADKDAFLVIDGALLVQAMSHHAEKLLGVAEDAAVNRPVAELLVAADAEARGKASFAQAVADAAAGEGEPLQAIVRPWNTFGVRMRARVAPCGPPRAALVVLDPTPARPLRVVPAS
jgi:hypothetical protein